jgi:predicted phosphoadenosine phosphosulfate sulfurtransferase
MSSNFWQMKKQSEQLSGGKTIIDRVRIYEKIWESRCYKDGIPEEIPAKLSKTLRVPSYKALALAILKNDFQFYSIGFPQRESEILNAIIKDK